MRMGAEKTVELNEFECKLLHILQYDFPLAPRPYKEIADRLQVTEETVLARVKQLFAKGLIRRLGASINSRQVGYSSVLVALKVASNYIPDVARVVNSFPGVTHNYLREGEYNMWFTAIAPDQDSLDTILNTIGSTCGVEAMIRLPAKRVFKVSVKFPLVAGCNYDRP
ncbi:transcriptional regulator, AsnC family [Sporolituus thermophilus DSM 23256]|uniref:siroheme decarboxylase n=2 Tax=Sporolituus TaxID=909931 RepID=A0A1G7LY25_9FIRM|nr:transcriptional regulator, AsnC family [Sporolituus thermophilus DSM 23256]